DDRQRGRLFVALAAVAWSSAGLLQRELSVDTATQTGGRAVFAAFGLLAYVVLTERGGTLRAFRVLGVGGAGGVVLRRVEPHVGGERAVHAVARADPGRGPRHVSRRSGGTPNVARDGRRRRGRRADGRRARPAERARPRSVARHVGLVRGDDRAHPPSPRGVDGAGDVHLAAARPRRRRTVRASGRGRRQGRRAPRDA